MSNYYTYRYASPLTWTVDSEAFIATATYAPAALVTDQPAPDWQTWAMGHALGAYCPVCPAPGQTFVPSSARRYIMGLDRTGLSLSCNTHPMHHTGGGPGSHPKTHTSWELVKAYYAIVDKAVPEELVPDPTWGEYGL